MEVKQIDQRFSVAGQLNAADLEEISDQGFKLVINFRPDNEGGDTQPTNAMLAEKAKELGLAYAYIPVIPNQIQPEHVDQLRVVLNQHEGSALGFCRTGNRANNVYQQTLQSDAMNKPDCCSQQGGDAQNLSSRVLGWLKR